MGQTWFMYARNKEDYWVKEPFYSTLTNENNIEYHMGRFKHRVFLFALGELDEPDVYKMYLYQGWSREVKCWFQEDTLKIQFSTERARNAWGLCRRSKKGLSFDNKFVKVNTNNKWVLHFTKST